MADQFPIVIRGYDKEQVDRAFASAQQTLAALRAQIKQDGDRLLQLQAKLQEERNRQSSKNHTFASLGANAQQMLASAEQTSTELLERAKQDARLDSRVRQGSGGDADQQREAGCAASSR